MPNEPAQWNPNFATGLALVDAEHQGLLARLNALIELLARDVPLSEWLPELDLLIDEVTQHFAHEEQIMDNVGYHGLPAHRQQHQHLLQEVAEFRHQLATDSRPQETLATMRFVKFWVLKHMVQEDIKIRHHIYRDLPTDNL